jgi:hypothetical protein
MSETRAEDADCRSVFVNDESSAARKKRGPMAEPAIAAMATTKNDQAPSRLHRSARRSIEGDMLRLSSRAPASEGIERG